MRIAFTVALWALLFATPAFSDGIVNGGGGGGGGTPGGTNGQIQFNNSGAFGGLTPAIQTGCQATGGTIGASLVGTISTQLTTSNTYTSNQTLASGDACHQVLLNDASAATLTFISANLTTGQYGRAINIGAGTWTLAAGTGVSAIKGCTSLAANQSGDWQFDGTNVNLACGASSGGSGNALFGTTSGNTSGDLVSLSNTTVGVQDSLVPAANFPVSSTVNGDIATFSNTTGKFQDSGTLLSSLAPLASPTFTGTVGAAALTATGVLTDSLSPGLSQSAVLISGAPQAGGSATTSFPLVYLNDGAAVTSFNTTGTALGINLPSASTANFLDFHLNGGSSLFSVGSTGSVTSANNLISLNTVVTSSTGGFRLGGNTYLTNPGGGGAGLFQMGQLDTFPTVVAQTLSVQSQSTGGSGQNNNGQNFTIIGSVSSGSGTSGDIIIQTGNTGGAASTKNTASTALTIKGNTQQVNFAGQITVASMTQSSAAQSGTVCYNTSGGAITYDATLGCLTSLEELKDIHGPITGALAEVTALKPFWFTPINRPAGSDLAEQPGFGAHQIEGVDKRLVGYGPNGELRGVRYMEITALEAAAIAELKAEFDEYRQAHP
jgi:hypothetical protein